MDAITITGGQGFTGRHITERLAAGAASSAPTGTDDDGSHME
jgi:nucleoside-diphosphate-sugar epimerase